MSNNKNKNRKKKRRINWKRVAHLFVLTLLLVGFMYLIYKGAHYLYAVGRDTVTVKSSQITDNLKQFREGSVSNDTGELYESDILERVARHLALPSAPLEAMLKVRDPAFLSSQSPVYEDVKRNDYILMYPKLIIIYDAKQDSIIRTVPLE